MFRVDGDGAHARVGDVHRRPAAIDDPELVDYGGRLMQWHVHENLCWRDGENGPAGRRRHRRRGQLPRGHGRAGGDNPMVHVWIVPTSAGRSPPSRVTAPGRPAATARTDQCAHDDGHSHDDAVRRAQAGRADGESAAGIAPCPSTRTADRPVGHARRDSASSRRSPRTSSSSTLRDLPQWADTAVAEAAGFQSIGDGATGYEHYIQWEWIDDDVWLDPDHPESLVYRVEPDGSRTLVSAMFMLPNSMALEDVPDWGGALMQWHVHSDLCFDVSDPEAPPGRRAHRLGRRVHRPARDASPSRR